MSADQDAGDVSGQSSSPVDQPKRAGRKAQVKKIRVIVDGRVRVFPVDKAERLIRMGVARRG